MKKILFFIAFAGTSIFSFGQQKGEWRARIRATHVSPQASASISTIGGNVTIGQSTIPELDFTYFFINRFSANLILGTTRNKVTATGTALGNIPLGKVWLLPPTLTFLYHQPLGHGILPYAGAGLNYTIFYGKRFSSPVADITYKNRFGFATQLGCDIDISKKWFVNVDAKKIWLKTSNDVTTVPLEALDNASATVHSNTKINPWLLSAGIGLKF